MFVDCLDSVRLCELNSFGAFVTLEILVRFY